MPTLTPSAGHSTCEHRETKHRPPTGAPPATSPLQDRGTQCEVRPGAPGTLGRPASPLQEPRSTSEQGPQARHAGAQSTRGLQQEGVDSAARPAASSAGPMLRPQLRRPGQRNVLSALWTQVLAGSTPAQCRGQRPCPLPPLVAWQPLGCGHITPTSAQLPPASCVWTRIGMHTWVCTRGGCARLFYVSPSPMRTPA